MTLGIETLEYIMAYDYDADDFEFVWETYDQIVTGCNVGIFSAELDFHDFPTDTIAITFNGDWSSQGIEVDAMQVYGTRTSLSNVRIVEGGSLTKGRIEVFNPDDGYWGTVCRSGELSSGTGELLAEQLGQTGFQRFTDDGDLPASMYASTIRNPQCSSSDDNILECLEQGWHCVISDVGIIFTQSSLGLCEGTGLEDSESYCTCHKIKTNGYQSSCLGTKTVCSPAVISVSGDIDAHLYTPPNESSEGSYEEPTNNEVTSTTSRGPTTAEETTSSGTTQDETTATETTYAQTTIRDSTYTETTIGDTTYAETTLGETTSSQVTNGSITIVETTLRDTTVLETTYGEMTPIEGMPAGDASIGGTTLGDITTGKITTSELGTETMTAISQISEGMSETPAVTDQTSLPFTIITVTSEEVVTSKVPTSDIRTVWTGDNSSILVPANGGIGYESNLHWAATKHCASLDCPTTLQYSDPGELLDLRNATVSCSSSKTNHGAQSAFLQKLRSDRLDYDYIMENNLLNYDFTGWRPTDDDSYPYLRVDFEMTVTVQGLVVLGGHGSEAHVTSIKIAYKDTRSYPWKYYHEDDSTEPVIFGLDYSPGYALLMFSRWREATCLILLPQSWHAEIWMRVFVLGATYEGGPVPLGMESREIRDVQISASSHIEGQPPREGRLHGPSAWCGSLGGNDPYILIDLLTRAHIHKVAIQGLDVGAGDHPQASGTYPEEIRVRSSTVEDGPYVTMTLELEGNSPNGAADIQEFSTTYDPVARYIKIKIKSSNTAYSCLRVEIYGYMNFELWPDFDVEDLDNHIDYANNDDIHLECSCHRNRTVEKYKEDYFLILSGDEIVEEMCPQTSKREDAVTPPSEWTDEVSGFPPGSSATGSTTAPVYTEMYSVEISSSAPYHGVTSSSASSWLCPGISPDEAFTSTVIFREVLTIRRGRVRFNYFLRGDDRTSWTLYERMMSEVHPGAWDHTDVVIASIHGSPNGSPGNWTEFYIDHHFSENYRLVVEFTIIADGYSLIAIEPEGFNLISESFIDPKESLLGMKSYDIKAHQISSSSERSVNTPATSARMNKNKGWCPSSTDLDPWIQVDMEREVYLNGITLQGRMGSNEWVTAYYIRVSDDGHIWRYYDDLKAPTIFEGSWSTDLAVLQSLPNPMYCRFIRIYPVANHTNPCIRFDLNGVKTGSVASSTTELQTTETVSQTTPLVTTNAGTTGIISTGSATTAAGPTTQGMTTAHITTGVSSSPSSSSSSPSSSQQTGGGGGNQSSQPSPSATSSEEMTTESRDEVPSQIIHATKVDEVFKAISDPNITVTFETASAALDVVDNLTRQSLGPLNREDIESIKGTLSVVSSKAASTKETAKTFLDIVGSILIPNDTLTDPDAASNENSTSQQKHASSIMELVESFATDAAKNLLSPTTKKVVIQNDNLVLHLTKISPEDTINSTDPVSVSVNSSTNELHFPSSVLKGKNATISAVVFNDLHLTTSSKLIGRHDNDTSTSVGSKIMSIQVEVTDGSITFSAEDPVELVLELNEDANTTNIQSLCVFWEFNEEQESGGVWSTAGCHRNQTQGTQITCHCDHLTNFAILLQVNPRPVVLSLAHRISLDMLTYVGLALSIAALICTLTTFVMLKLLKSQRTIIHTNLCIALLFAQLLYLVGIERTASKAVCTTIAVILHYLFTSTFSWMLMEGVYILMQSRSAYGKGGKTWMYMLAGWGSPVVIILISLGIRLDGYGTDNYCWLSVENGFMWAFATPVLAVLAMNTIVLIMVIRVFMALKANLDKTEAERLRAGVRAVLLLQPLLGFTWVFGLLAAYDPSLFFAYMFVIFNSLQGVFIFIVNCLMNEEVKKAFKTKYHRSSSRLRRRSTHTTQISTTDTSVAFKTTRAFMDRTKTNSKYSKTSSVVEGLALKVRSTKVQPLSDDKTVTRM